MTQPGGGMGEDHVPSTPTPSLGELCACSISLPLLPVFWYCSLSNKKAQKKALKYT